MTEHDQRAVAPRLDLTSRGLLFGGDYNPEQWPEATLDEDIELMREAGVNLATVGVFSWSLLEPEDGRYETDWLGRVLDRLHGGGIWIDLATGTASPPAWFTHAHPESRITERDGTVLSFGGRQDWCPSSPVYREKSLQLVEVMAERFGRHPGLILWHVSNELGCHNAACYCDISAVSFRRWLRERYGDLDSLNAAWGTTFWSQRYSDWEQIQPPRVVPAAGNPTQELDFRRFSSDELLGQHLAEREVLRRHTPEIPVTTNFMVTTGFDGVDYASWAPHVDVVSNDHYTRADDPQRHVDLAFNADRTRSLSPGEPWMLMEHSTSAVNWQPRNRAKAPGELRRNSLQHLARGSDAICFFQWRASRAGAEKFHSAMLPHGGRQTKVWQEVVQLGSDLRALSEIVGTTVSADVAIVIDYPSQWALHHPCGPSVDLDPEQAAKDLYAALWKEGVTTDVVPSTADLSGYRMVLVPSLYLLDQASADRLRDYAAGGGCLVVTYFSGICDEHDHVYLGGYPGALREVLGIRTEEFYPLLEGEQVALDDGSTGTRWSEHVHLEGAEAIASFDGGPLDGVPALTRHQVGDGVAWYLATHLDADATHRFLAERLAEGSIPRFGPPDEVEMVERRSETDRYAFVLNHGTVDVEVALAGTDLLTGESAADSFSIPAGGVRVIRRDRAEAQAI